MTRTKAFLIHLSISFLIFLIILYLAVFHWYPGFLFNDDGGWQIMRLVAGVCLVLGPLLTLILFKPGKWGLTFDMWIISIIQIVALSWVTWAAYHERPYVIVYADYYFKPLTQYQFLAAKAPPNILDKACLSKPCLIYSNLPQNRDERNQIRKKALQTATPIHMFGEYYKPFSSDSITTMKNENIDLVNLLINDVIERKISYDARDKLVAYQKFSNRLMFFPVSSRYKETIIVFDPTNYSIIDTIDHNLRSYQ